MKTMKLTVAILAIFVSATVYGQSLKVNVEKSIIKWNGKKVVGEHYGSIKIKSGLFEIKNNAIVSGTFVIDMNTITCADLEDEGYNAKLVGHLKSDDFFGVDMHPTAELQIKEASEFKNDKAHVKANLTIKGKTNAIEFEAKKMGSEYTALITVDRSKYDVKYGSTSFFDNLGDKAISDEFTLNVKLVTK